MTVTSFWSVPTLAQVSASGGHPEYAATEPQNQTIGAFRELSAADQIAYLERWGVGPNKEVKLGPLQTSPTDAPQVSVFLRTDANNQRTVVTPASDRVFDPTPGELLPHDQRRPYHELPGSPTGGGLSKAGAEALFPKLTGLEGKTLSGPKPEGWEPWPLSTSNKETIGAFLAKFATWHSAHQAEFIRTKGTNNALTLSHGGEVLFSAAISPTSGKIYNIGNLTKQDLATMPKDDRDRLAASPTSAAFASRLATLGLEDQSAVSSLFTASLSKLSLGTATHNIPAGTTGSALATDCAKPFRDQITILQTQVNAQGLVDSTQIRQQIQDIEKRFDRMKAFYDHVHRAPETPSHSYGGGSIRVNVASLDQGKAIKEGLEIFVRQEERIAESTKRRHEISQGGGTIVAGLANGIQVGPGGKPLDLPTLIYVLQNEYNIQKEAEVASDTEVVRQMNELLKAYTLFQASVNKTIGAFSKDDMDKQNARGIEHYNDGVREPLQSDDSRARVWSMFNDQFVNGHPLENLTGNPRPTFPLFIEHVERNKEGQVTLLDIRARRHTPNAWQQYQTTLSERVNSLNQDSQVRMNEINNKDKERNRHFDQANNALQKMNDALQSILRAG